MLFVRLASTSLKDEESARDSHVLACNFARYLVTFLAHAVYTPERAVCLGLDIRSGGSCSQ